MDFYKDCMVKAKVAFQQVNKAGLSDAEQINTAIELFKNIAIGGICDCTGDEGNPSNSKEEVKKVEEYCIANQEEILFEIFG